MIFSFCYTVPERDSVYLVPFKFVSAPPCSWSAGQSGESYKALRTRHTIAVCSSTIIIVSVEYNGGFLPDMILLTQCYYHRGTRLNAIKRFFVFAVVVLYRSSPEWSSR